MKTKLLLAIVAGIILFSCKKKNSEEDKLVFNSVQISRDSVSLNIGSSYTLNYFCKDQKSASMTCPTLTWSSSNNAVATVNSSGMVTGVSMGKANISASAEGKSSNNVVFTIVDATTPTYIGIPTGSEVITATQITLEQEVFDLINQVRNDTFGLSPALVRDAKLDNAARYHIMDMIKDYYFCHPSYDAGGSETCGSSTGLAYQCSRFDRIQKFLSTSNNDEALALGFSTSNDVVIAWLGHQSHRDILSMSWGKKCGVGVIANPVGGGYYWAFEIAAYP